ncbi:uncharacterized protein LOC117258917 [Epinephelus lanceolatus]|uniref:uncharacterized protein LOC117258917 n=1 Tax=Epinephelus lanceolatus TaxID=310571 RepID=UPI001447EFE1|nr:uncharacterized protein LOC117258917 [Epinephelus lanceolatus]
MRKKKHLSLQPHDDENMSQKVLFIKLLLLHYTTQSQFEMNADCNTNVSVKCPGVDLGKKDFISLAWYKFNNKEKVGIIRKGKQNSIQDYDFPRSPKPEFGEQYSLFLARATPNDSGIYECDISANVGGQNLNLKVNLTVQACVIQTDLTTVSTMTTVSTTSQLNLTCSSQGEDLPVMWSILGYVAVGLAKIIFSLISIRVIQAVRMRSSRRRRHRW